MNRREHFHSTAFSPLASSSLKVVITDLLAEYELRHTFQNNQSSNIEAVYSFPIPLDAAFGGMRARLAGETLVAQIRPARKADRDYDSAIANGNSAVLLEEIQPGMLCVTLGNLRPGEDGEIVLRFYSTLATADYIARFSLPLLHRPRYGRSYLNEELQPVHHFAVKHPLEAEIRIRGLLADCPVQSAIPGARFSKDQNDTVLQLDRAMLDRDLVLSFELGNTLSGQAHLVEDGPDSIGIISFTLPKVELPSEPEAPPRNICLLLDCSGSMQGDAIAQSRKALLAVVDALKEQDYIQVLRFGSAPQALLRKPLPATPLIKRSLQELVSTVDANLGGTEMALAVRQGLDALSGINDRPGSSAIILVTDGAVNPQDLLEVTAQAKQRNIRVFVVAVGSSAGVDALAPLASNTDAVMERTVPTEPIDTCVMRQFRRVRNMPANIHIDWGDHNVRPLPIGISYPGDTVTAIAQYLGQNSRLAKVTTQLPGSDLPLTLQIHIGPIKAFPAMRTWTGQQIYLHAQKDREQLALDYGLITPHTKAVLTKTRPADSKADSLPVLVPIEHMAPAGTLFDCDLPERAHGIRHRTIPTARSDVYDYDTPAFLRKADNGVSTMKKRSSVRLTGRQMVALANALAELLLTGVVHPSVSQIVARIDPTYRQLIHSYLISVCNIGPDLLQELLDEGVELRLDKKHETRLADLLAAYTMSN